MRLDQLLQRLEGQAAEFAFTQLSPATLHSYHDLKAELNSRFRVVETSKTFAAKYTRRNQKHGETTEAYAAELKMLYDKAHPHRDRRTRDEDLVRRFLDGLLDEDTRFEVEYHKEPATIDDGVYNVVTLLQTRGGIEGERGYKRTARRTIEPEKACEEAHPDLSKQPAYRKPNRWSRRPPLDSTKASSSDEILQHILKRLNDLKGRSRGGHGERRSKRDMECFRCHEKGHVARECTGTELSSETTGKMSEDSNSGSHSLNGNGPALAAKGRSQ